MNSDIQLDFLVQEIFFTQIIPVFHFNNKVYLKMSQLILILLKKEQSEELERVAKDPEYCKKLMKEYGLE